MEGKAMAIRAVIFDFGGVLVRTEDTSGRRKWEARFGLPDWGLERLIFGSEASTKAQLGQATEADIWQHVVDTLKLSQEELAQLQRDFWLGDRLDDDLVHFLRDLRPRYKTAVLSNAWPNARQVFTELFGLGNAVDAMVISSEEGIMKPDARIYQIAAERLGIQPEEAVFVDDMAANIQGAQAIGMHGIQFESTDQVVKEVRKALEG
jgi:epoxide hydrolase-like predicted phosphatase